ncbi:MAG: PorV/PorQ family protein [bacterium]
MVRRQRLLWSGFLLGLAFSLGSVSSGVAGGILDLYGEENVGAAGAQFLRIPVGARSVALGRAYTACATDAATLFWNPAGILRTPGRRNLFAAHTVYTADIDLDYFAYHSRGQNFGYGLSLGMLRSGDIPRTDEFHQEGTGTTFRADQYLVGLTLARAMTDRFSIGGTVKLYQENLDEFEIRSIMADLGILYFVGLGDMRVGFSVRNFGPKLRPNGEPPPLLEGFEQAGSFQSFAAPTVGSFGITYTFELSEKIGLLTTSDFSHPSDYTESFHWGVELGLNEMLFLRAGYETGRHDGGFATGFGVKVGRDRLVFRLDYAYSDMGLFGTIHHFSVDLVPLMGRIGR